MTQTPAQLRAPAWWRRAMKPTLLVFAAITGPVLAANQPVSGLLQRGPVVATDQLPILPNGATSLQAAYASDVANYVLTSVKAYGAKGDGVSDDTAAIQAAINTGLPIYFPPGVYVTSSSLLVESYTNNGQVLRGSGSYYGSTSAGFSTTPPPGTAVIRPTSAVSKVFVVDGTPVLGAGLSYLQSFGIENLAIDMANMADSSSSSAIYQVQAFDIHYRGVRVINDGNYKQSWSFNAGSFTTNVQDSEGGVVNFSGASFSNAATTITLVNDDIRYIYHDFYQNVTITGGAIQRPYVGGVTPITYLAPGTTPYGFPPNTAGLYVAVLSEINDSLQFSSIGADWELGSTIPATCTVPGWSFGTYNDGTHGCLKLIAVLRVDANAVDTTFVNPTFAGMYLLDYGVNTRLVGQALSNTNGVDIHNGVGLEQSSFGVAGTIFGYTNLANYLDYGTGTTWSLIGSTGAASFENLVVKPAADGASVFLENASGTAIGSFGTSGTPTWAVSGISQGYQLKAQPSADGTAVTLLNAAGTPLMFATTNATPSSSQWNFANGTQVIGYSDSFSTQQWFLNSATGAAQFRSVGLSNPGSGNFTTLAASTSITAPAYSAGSAAGVSCTGVPTASFATINGIVTHC